MSRFLLDKTREKCLENPVVSQDVGVECSGKAGKLDDDQANG
jgi:hypothetical protein